MARMSAMSGASIVPSVKKVTYMQKPIVTKKVPSTATNLFELGSGTNVRGPSGKKVRQQDTYYRIHGWATRLVLDPEALLFASLVFSHNFNLNSSQNCV